MKSKIIFNKEAGEVIKICNSPSEFKKELYIFEKSLDNIPKLINHDNRIKLVLEYIPGKRLLDMSNPNFSQIATLFSELHSVERHKNKVICQVDTNPRNYLGYKGKYFMLDFAEWEYNEPEVDLINFLLFWASMQRDYKFRNTCHEFLNSYHQQCPINVIEWEILLADLIEKFDWRRSIYCKKERTLTPDTATNREYLANINSIIK